MPSYIPTHNHTHTYGNNKLPNRKKDTLLKKTNEVVRVERELKKKARNLKVTANFYGFRGHET